MHHFFEDEQNVYLLMEHYDAQELYLYAKQSRLNERQVAFVFAQLAEGIHYLQSLKVMHRDLKLSNILVDAKLQVKIIDFGCAVQLTDFDEEHHSLCGTPNYVSPDVINKNHGLQTDLWSLGCILYYLLAGTAPFECPTV
jgi:serine/threonine protein kinase